MDSVKKKFIHSSWTWIEFRFIQFHAPFTNLERIINSLPGVYTMYWIVKVNVLNNEWIIYSFSIKWMNMNRYDLHFLWFLSNTRIIFSTVTMSPAWTCQEYSIVHNATGIPTAKNTDETLTFLSSWGEQRWENPLKNSPKEYKIKEKMVRFLERRDSFLYFVTIKVGPCFVLIREIGYGTKRDINLMWYSEMCKVVEIIMAELCLNEVRGFLRVGFWYFWCVHVGGQDSTWHLVFE